LWAHIYLCMLWTHEKEKETLWAHEKEKTRTDGWYGRSKQEKEPSRARDFYYYIFLFGLGFLLRLLGIGDI